jgi:lathosterol oxidase
MPLEFLGIVTSLPGLLVVQCVAGLLLYFSLSALSYWYFFVLKKDKYFAGEEPPDPAEMKKAMRLAVIGTIGNAILATPIQWAAFHGYGKIYYHVAERGWGYYVFSALLFLFVTETIVYWNHRWLHHPYIYKKLHLYHHEYRKPTPWVSMAFHPLDSFAQAAPHYLCAFLFPVHISIYAGFVVYVMLWTFFIHDRVSWFRFGIVNYTAHHTMHHIYNKYNFGQFLTIWDRIAGTYRDPKKEVNYAVLK